MDLGMVAYEGYRACADGRSVITGAPIPPWDETDPRVRECWRAAADCVTMTNALASTRRNDRPAPTSWCPAGPRCESCGQIGGVGPAVLPVLGAVVCLAMCPTCAKLGRLPNMHLDTVVKLAAEHAGHVARMTGPTERRVVRQRAGGLPPE